ncbi:hypothetical protein SAMN05216456_0865 [Devosia crocina]|uniref:Uncharacterized protein n=1 Tax=Devosia crocina TaxID=429728 RepID=A0A1I7N5F0_9HYPH|nr:hypothetical protein [Devosia crocina]SFV29899.1 hypothetical protein SAMN05216456_0865 [Devosia crocina]
MVAVTNTYYSAYRTGSAASMARTSAASSNATHSTAETSATSVTLSEEAKAALSEKSFAGVLAEARSKLTGLLKAAGRTTPLEKGQLALDLSTIDAREIYAIASDSSFSADEREAAELEMQRRLEAALSGPHAIAKVTGDFTSLYTAAASFLDSLGPEEKASADWQASRSAVADGLKQLEKAPGKLPQAGEDDPVALYIQLVDMRGALDQSLDTLAANARTALDQRYAAITANGRIPSFKPGASPANAVDLSGLSSRTLSAIVLNEGDQFSTQEIQAAKANLRTKSSAALMAGLKSASQSGDPTAFSQNVIAAFSSLSPEERLAAGWSDKLYEAAVANYATSNKLLSMLDQLGGSGTGKTGTGLAGLLGNW